MRNPYQHALRRTETVDYAALVRQVQAGDQKALDELLDRAQAAAYRFSVLVCGHAEDTEDAMQEALIKTYRHVRRIRDPEAFRGWLYRTVRNACLIGRRKRAAAPDRLISLEDTIPDRRGVARPIEAVDRSRGPDEITANVLLRRRLRDALAQLPPPYRVVLVLRDMEGLSTREVAGVVGTSEANVKARLHRARKAIRGHLGAHRSGEPAAKTADDRRSRVSVSRLRRTR